MASECTQSFIVTLQNTKQFEGMKAATKERKAFWRNIHDERNSKTLNKASSKKAKLTIKIDSRIFKKFQKALCPNSLTLTRKIPVAVLFYVLREEHTDVGQAITMRIQENIKIIPNSYVRYPQKAWALHF